MSDISINFPAWMTPVLIGLLYWPLLLAVAASLAGLGMCLRGRRRAAVLGLAGLVALPCMLVIAMDIASALHSASARRAYTRTHETLSAPVHMQGMDIPAGTAVTWADERHERVTAMELPGPSPVLGTTLTGKLEDVSGLWWSGTLAADAVLGGWPCRAGDVWLSAEGGPMRCTLADDHQYEGFDIPAGSEVALSRSGRLRDVRLPADRTMALPSIAAMLPGGGSVFLRPDGAIERAYVPEPGVLQLGDAALRFDITWIYNRAAPVALRGELAEDAVIDGMPAAKGSMVTIGARHE
jgi:hypothetical protein